jgi:hypothetical protein
MVEFALMAPMLFLLLMGIIVAAIVVTNMVQLQNTVRDAARAAAVCGGPSRPTGSDAPTLPGGLSCTSLNLPTFFNTHLSAIPAGAVQPYLCVEINGASCTGVLATSENVFDQCDQGQTIEVQASYAQPLYLPLVGTFFGSGGSNSRTLSASATAVCEQ